MSDTHDHNWYDRALRTANWPHVPQDLHARIMQRTADVIPASILPCSAKGMSLWVAATFTFAFIIGIMQSPALLSLDTTAAPYYFGAGTHLLTLLGS